MGEPSCPACASGDVFWSRKRRRYICGDCDTTFGSAASASLKFFFSYGHDSNEPLVRRLKTDLESRGHSVWIDSARIRTGADWRKEITDGLLNADGIVSFLSRHSVRVPGVCLDELRIALCVKSGRIRTVLLESEEDVAPPSSLSDVQWLDMSGWAQLHTVDPEAFEDWYRDRFVELCEMLESDDARAFAGDITELRKRLRPHLSDSKERHLLTSDYVGREWLANELEQWRTQPDSSRAFVVFGGPGVGKSRFAVEQFHTNPSVLCCLLCEWSGGESDAVQVLIRTLAFRLATRLPDYRRLLVTMLAGDAPIELFRLNDDACFDALITYPMSQLIDGGRDPRLIIIDGIDELDQGSVNPLAELLARHLRRLPPWLKVVLTSRPEGSVRATFADWKPRVIPADDEKHLLDVRQYLAVTLRDQLRREQGTVQLLDKLVAATEGSFLYATLLTESAAEPGFSLSETEVRPRGLDAFYLRSFQRRFPDLEAYRSVRDLIEILVILNPVPTFLLHDVVGRDAYAVRDLLRQLGSLVVTGPRSVPEVVGPLDSVAFCHKSIPDWLTDSDRADHFYVDRDSGRRRVAHAIIGRLPKPRQTGSSEATTQEDLSPEDMYRSTRAAAILVESGMWEELEDFLTSSTTPLWPYWRVIGTLPPDRLGGSLLDYLWRHPERDSFFRQLQRHGDRTVTVDTVKRFAAEHGSSALGLGIADVYIDALHLNGRYREAVTECDRVLAGRTRDEVLGDQTLLRLAVRRLHHRMFFAPVDPLIAEAVDLRDRCDPQRFPDLFNELLFLIGGNLGLLSGDFAAARPVLEESLDFARRRGAADFEIRSLRKVADLLRLEDHGQEAHGLLSSLVSPECELTSRYHMYLLGSLGESCRTTGRLAQASVAFEALGRHAAARGVPGWHAHSLLGLALLSAEVGQVDDGWAFLSSADSIYQEISQAWGRIASTMVANRLGEHPSSATTTVMALGQAEALATSLNYRYEAATLRRLAAGTSSRIHLLFL